MVYRIIGYCFFGFMIIALVLSFAGVTEVYMGNGFRNWLVAVNVSYNGWKVKIPDIPDIPYLETSTEVTKSYFRNTRVVTVPVIQFNSWKNQLKSILNLFIFFVNLIIQILNIVVIILNIVISVLQFIFTMVYQVRLLPKYLTGDTWTRWNGESTIWWWPSIGQ